MPTCEITPCSPSRTSTSRSFESPISDHPEDIFNNARAIGSRQNEGSLGTERIIAIALKAHEKMRMEPFAYALNHLVEQRNCKVVVICCLSKVRNEMGIDLFVDLQNFGGISKKKLDAAISVQRDNLNHFLRLYRETLNQRGVQLDIRISPGRKSDDILTQVANEIHPCWVVLDMACSSFSGHQKKLQKALDCNLVLIKKNFRDSKPLILNSTPKHLSPADQTHEQASEKFELVQESSARNSISETSARNSISETSARNSISETSARNSISETSARSSISETSTRNSISETSARNSISSGPTPTPTTKTRSTNGTNPTITIKTSSSNGPTPSTAAKTSSSNGTTATITVETSVGVHNTTNAATSNINSQSGPPVPPIITSPTQIAAQGLSVLRSAFTSPAPQLSSPPTTPNPPTQSRPPVPPVLASPNPVATQGLQVLRSPAPRLSLSATPPPNPPTPPSQSNPSSPTSSGSGTSTGQENRSTSLPPSEPVNTLSSGEVPFHTVLPEQSGPPAPRAVSPTQVATLADPLSSFFAALPNSPSERTRPASSGSLSALKNYLNDIKKAASKLEQPTDGGQSWRTSKPNFSGSGTSISQANRPSPLLPSEPIPYHVELAMALNASIVSASEEGVPVSPTSQQSFSWDEALAKQSEPIPDDIALAMTLSASIQTASEEGVSLSPLPPQNPSSWDGNRGNRGPPSSRNNADRRDFGGWVECEHPSYSYTGWGPGYYPGTATSRPGRFSVPDSPSTSRTSIPTPPRTSSQSGTSSVAPSAPPLPTYGSISYPSVGTSPTQINCGPSAKVMFDRTPIPNAKEKSSGGHCVICYDAPADAVCIPCGHMAGCKDCLTRIKSKGCPVCRAPIQQVIKVYAVS